MKNVAIYGGSFDPPTLGHVFAIIDIFVKNPDIEEVVVVPCCEQEGKNLLWFDHRYNMAIKAFEYLSNVWVSDIELGLKNNGLTYKTLECLKRMHPKWNMRFVMGSDLRESYKTWEGSEVIDELAPPLFVDRPKFQHTAAGMLLAVSSTIVREQISKGNMKAIEKFLPSQVAKYIKQHNLYNYK